MLLSIAAYNHPGKTPFAFNLKGVFKGLDFSL